jgi:predicted transcriptional regulator
MNRNTVDRGETGSKVLSARLTQQEWKNFQEILRNYKIQKSSVSDQLRELLRRDLWRSRRYRRKWRAIHG